MYLFAQVHLPEGAPHELGARGEAHRRIARADYTMYVYLHLSLPLSLYTYIYIYTYVCICMCVYIYI